MSNYSLSCKGIDKLENELLRLNKVRFDAVAKKNITQMFNRSRGTDPAQGGTPVSNEQTRPGGPHGELRKSASVSGISGDSSAFDAEIGYNSEYAAHVEYGHRTRNGGFVQGQKFLYHNVEIQRDIYTEDLKKAIKKG